MFSGWQQRGMLRPGGLVSVITWTIILQPLHLRKFKRTGGAPVCSTWQVHKSPGWGDYDMARPWGPDALSASTAEPAMDASRPSPRTFPEEAREYAQMCTSTNAPRTRSSCHPSRLPLLHHLLAPLLFFPFSFIFTHCSWRGQRRVGKEMVSPARWPLTLLWRTLLFRDVIILESSARKSENKKKSTK